MSFCLNYADMRNVPLADTPRRWIKALDKAGMYAEAGSARPQPGDLVFFETDAPAEETAVAIITEVDRDDTTITMVLGDQVQGRVTDQTCALDDKSILGYGLFSTSPADDVSTIQLTAQSENVFAAAEFTPGVLPDDAAMEITPLYGETPETCEIVHRLEPDGTVSVSLSFSDPLEDRLSRAFALSTPPRWNLIHIHEASGFEDMTAWNGTVLETALDNRLESVRFKSDSFSEYVLFAVSENTRVSETNMKTYLESRGDALGMLLLNTDNTEVRKDENGACIVTAGQSYKLMFSIDAQNGIQEGTYYYQLPFGMDVEESQGAFTTKEGTTIGIWAVDASGKITFVFHVASNDRQDVRIGGSMGVIFSPSDETIEVEGMITVTVKQPADEEGYLTKWGYFDENNGQKYIKWRIEMQGSNDDMPVVGQTITDNLQGNQQFRGNVTMAITDAAGTAHATITISDAPEFEWIDENSVHVGWKYTIPESVICNCSSCNGQPFLLQDEDWYYCFRCEAWPLGDAVFDETTLYKNSASLNTGKSDTAKVGSSSLDVVKTGSYDAENDAYNWSVTMTVPGGLDANRLRFTDSMKIEGHDIDLNGDGAVNGDDDLYVDNNIDRVVDSVIMKSGDEVYPCPILYFDGSDERNAWFRENPDYLNGSYFIIGETETPETILREDRYYKYNYEVWHACSCQTGAVCPTCGSTYCSNRTQRNGFCRSWVEARDTIITFQYSTPAAEIIGAYGGNGWVLQNRVDLTLTFADESYLSASDRAECAIPGMFSYELPETGGSGTTPYLLWGAVLMAVPLFLELRCRRRRAADE